MGPLLLDWSVRTTPDQRSTPAAAVPSMLLKMTLFAPLPCAGDWSESSKLWDSKEGRAVEKSIKAMGGTTSSRDGRFWIKWDDFTKCFASIEWCHMHFSDDDRDRRAALIAQAKEKVKLSSVAKGGKVGDDGPVRTQESGTRIFTLAL